MRKFFAGKNVVITGGSKGIGLAMARELARRSANLALIARGQAELNAARESLGDFGVKIVTYSCDVTDAGRLECAISEAAEALGGLDGVIANSGYCHPGYFHRIRVEDASQQIDTNLKGCIYALHHAVPHLIKRGNGFIAITSSPAGSMGVFGFSVYGATKAALNNLAETLRYEYAGNNITVHLLLPPDTQTPGYEQEVLLYPKETKAVLEGGKLFSAEAVARRFVDAIERDKKQVTVGFETHLALLATRCAPWLWDAYVKWKIRSVRAKEKAL